MPVDDEGDKTSPGYAERDSHPLPKRLDLRLAKHRGLRLVKALKITELTRSVRGN